MCAAFQPDGREILCTQRRPAIQLHVRPSPAISLLVSRETRQEVDELWKKLSAGEEKSRCGWLQDKYGLSWQIIPAVIGKMLQDKDAGKAKRVMLQMGKIESNRLPEAYEQA